MKMAKTPGTMNDITQLILGNVFIGARGTADAVFISTSVPDRALVPASDHMRVGTEPCIVGFANRIRPWKYEVMIGQRKYGLAADDNGDALIVAEINTAAPAEAAHA
jgi:hypothetical protein